MIDILLKYRNIFNFICIYGIICAIMFVSFGEFLFIMLVWNVFLAALPLLFINKFLYHCEEDRKIKTVIWGMLWLLFFPNSVYMITDFIHISKSMNSAGIYAWLKLLVIGIGVIYGCIFGLESLHLFYKILREKTSFLVAGFSVCMVSLLSGFGVYIGRFLRFNSWDILKPISLFQEIFSDLSAFTIQFTFGFAGFILVIFIFYSLLIKKTFLNADVQ